MRSEGIRDDIFCRWVDAGPRISMLGPVRCPIFKSFAPQQQVKGQVHLLSQGRSNNIVVIATGPSAIREAVTVLPAARPEACMTPSIEICSSTIIFSHGDFPLANIRTCFLVCQGKNLKFTQIQPCEPLESLFNSITQEVLFKLINDQLQRRYTCQDEYYVIEQALGDARQKPLPHERTDQDHWQHEQVKEQGSPIDHRLRRQYPQEEGIQRQLAQVENEEIPLRGPHEFVLR